MTALRASAFALVALYLAAAASTVRAGKHKHRYTTATIAMTGNCHVNLRSDNMIRLKNGKNICRYRGKYHTPGATWFDTSRCMQCICLAPNGIQCCNILLKPLKMPKRCELDPHPRWTTVPLLASCMAPIVSTKSRKRVCKDRRLNNALRHTRWTPVSGHPNQLRAVKRKRGNF